MDYKDALLYALQNNDLVSNYDRLNGSNLGQLTKSMKSGGINWMIDVSTGRVNEELRKFDKMFFKMIWQPLSQNQKL